MGRKCKNRVVTHFKVTLAGVNLINISINGHVLPNFIHHHIGMAVRLVISNFESQILGTNYHLRSLFFLLHSPLGNHVQCYLGFRM